MKKTYSPPTQTVVRIQHQGLLMQSIITQIDSNVDILYGGGGSGDALAPELSDIDIIEPDFFNVPN
jgi:hypothetical protein